MIVCSPGVGEEPLETLMLEISRLLGVAAS